MRVAVADDEPFARSGVIARLTACGDVMLAGEYADGPSALAGLSAQPVDLVVIDVQMPGMDGLHVLAALPAAHRPLAILLTAHDRFAVQAFALDAVDYLLKPVDDDRFVEALDRARKLLAWRLGAASQGHEDPAVRHSGWLARFEVRVGRRMVYVDADEIDWIEADGDYVTLHAGGRSHLLRESLYRLGSRLDPTYFVRVHRSAIVRVDRVAELQPMTNRDAMLRLHDGTPMRVSRTYIDTLLARLRGVETPSR